MTTSNDRASSHPSSARGNGKPAPTEATNVAGEAMPAFGETNLTPDPVPLETVLHPDGRMSQYPPPEKWDDWVEWDSAAWPKKVARHYSLV
ncbi:MAG: hypothetical protein GY796_17485, partial [Chloroflexi bacterium]|nr:hypothetical protein [Chloroflexota bacterium]